MFWNVFEMGIPKENASTPPARSTPVLLLSHGSSACANPRRYDSRHQRSGGLEPGGVRRGGLLFCRRRWTF